MFDPIEPLNNSMHKTLEYLKSKHTRFESDQIKSLKLSITPTSWDSFPKTLNNTRHFNSPTAKYSNEIKYN